VFCVLQQANFWMVFSTAEVNDASLRVGFVPHMVSIVYRFCGFTTTAQLPAIFLLKCVTFVLHMLKSETP
jgi:hypothetical protein